MKGICIDDPAWLLIVPGRDPFSRVVPGPVPGPPPAPVPHNPAPSRARVGPDLP